MQMNLPSVPHKTIQYKAVLGKVGPKKYVTKTTPGVV